MSRLFPIPVRADCDVLSEDGSGEKVVADRLFQTMAKPVPKGQFLLKAEIAKSGGGRLPPLFLSPLGVCFVSHVADNQHEHENA